MFEIALIGAGNMAREIGKRLIKYGNLKPEQIIATHYNHEKAKIFEEKTGIKVIFDNKLAVKNSKIIVLCVRPQQVKEIIDEISPVYDKEKVLVNIAVGVKVEWLSEALRSTNIIHFHPTSLIMVTEDLNPGISLWTYHKKINKEYERKIYEIFTRSIGEIWKIPEENMPIFIFLIGNSPAYFVRILKSFIIATRKVINTPEIDITNLYYGLLKSIYTGLIVERKSVDEIINNIATKQGVTEKGIKFLESVIDIDSVIEKLKEITVQEITKISKKFE